MNGPILFSWLPFVSSFNDDVDRRQAAERFNRYRRGHWRPRRSDRRHWPRGLLLFANDRNVRSTACYRHTLPQSTIGRGVTREYDVRWIYARAQGRKEKGFQRSRQSTSHLPCVPTFKAKFRFVCTYVRCFRVRTSGGTWKRKRKEKLKVIPFPKEFKRKRIDSCEAKTRVKVGAVCQAHISASYRHHGHCA